MIVVIPARSGSKGIANKNFRNFAGSNLTAITVEQALALTHKSNVFVSSDSKVAKSLSEKYGVRYIERPSGIASDEATAWEVILHAIVRIEELLEKNISDNELICYLQPTSPLRPVQMIKAELDKMRDTEPGLISIRICRESAFKQFLLDDKRLTTELFPGGERLAMNRQSLPKTYMATGDVFAFRRRLITNSNSFPILGLRGLEMQDDETIDIDTMEEFLKAEQQFNHLGRLGTQQENSI